MHNIKVTANIMKKLIVSGVLIKQKQRANMVAGCKGDLFPSIAAKLTRWLAQ